MPVTRGYVWGSYKFFISFPTFEAQPRLHSGHTRPFVGRPLPQRRDGRAAGSPCIGRAVNLTVFAPGAYSTMEGAVTDRFLGIIAGVVAQMKAASAFSAPGVCERLLAQLVEQFEADAAFLRHNDHSLRASTLIAEWPPRDAVADPYPLAKIPFADADGVVAEELKTPTVIAADTAKLGHSSRFAARRGRASVTAVAPLLWGTVTTGVLGLTRFGGEHWTPEELDVLGVVAS